VSPWDLLLVGWIGMAAVMLALYGVERITKNAGCVDVGWAGGVGVLGVFYAWTADGDPTRRVLIAVLAGLWGFRLAAHILRRVLSEAEDGRYRMLRERWGPRGKLYFFLFFQIQAIWAVMFSVPFLPVVFDPSPALTWLDSMAAGVWLVAVAGEATADWQLSRFRARPDSRGKTCRYGLWRYSRHPNYFFEWVHWFTYVFLAIGAPYGWVALVGPVVMLLFLYKVTGIPYTEKRALQSRGEDYRRYQRTTSAFVPGFPKQEEAL